MTGSQVYTELVRKYYPELNFKGKFSKEDKKLLARAIDLCSRYHKQFPQYCELVFVWLREKGEYRPPTLLELATQRTLLRLFKEQRFTTVWDGRQHRQHRYQDLINTYLREGQYWHLTMIPADELAGNEEFVRMWQNEEFNIWQRQITSYMEAQAK